MGARAHRRDVDAAVDAARRGAVQMFRQYAAIHQSMADEEGGDVPGVRTRVVREPVGVVRAIIPWNGLVAAAAVKLRPALAAGCTVVLKPAPEGPLTSYLLAEAIEAAGLP